MKATRKSTTARKPLRRRSPALSISARIERLEKAVLFKAAPQASANADAPRFINLGPDGKPTAGEHVAVLDRQTGLTWTAAPLADGKGMGHVDAMKACQQLKLLGHEDWRAPTVRELLSIIDYERFDPAVDPSHFKGPYGWTWTATPFKGNPSGAAWNVGLDNGDSGWSGHGYHSRVRAVRAGQNLGLLD